MTAIFLALALASSGTMSMRTTLDARAFSNGTDPGFSRFRSSTGRWGYDWEYFEVEGNRFLAYADHHDGSFIYRWNGEKFEYLQFLAQRGGRTFKFFEADGNAYLAFANILSDSALCR